MSFVVEVEVKVVTQRRNRYIRAFPAETRQLDRVPVLFVAFLRWRRYWRSGVFQIHRHKDDKSNDEAVGSRVSGIRLLTLPVPLYSVRIYRFPYTSRFPKGLSKIDQSDRSSRS